jgi:DNA/RNA endonuclease G (NUC1)
VAAKKHGTVPLFNGTFRPSFNVALVRATNIFHHQLFTLKKISLKVRDPDTNKTMTINAVISDKLINRPGYDSGFLNKKIKLPTIPATLKKNIATVQSDVGSNGNKVLDYYNFSVVFNKNKKLPFYTAVNIEGDTNVMGMVHEERGSDTWYPDYRLSIDDDTLQYGNKDYKGSGFQKGHMVRYFDPAWGSSKKRRDEAMGDTFHYSNCCPQIPYYNSVVWNYLEDYYLARAIFQDKKVVVFSGPIFNKAKTINGLLIPVNFWKVVAYNKPNGKVGAMGFVMSHERYLDKLKKKRTMGITKLVQPTLSKDDIQRLYDKQEIVEAKVKISFIEEKTGLKFGLNTVDEKKTDARYDAELIQPTPMRVNALSVNATRIRQMKSLTALLKAM